MNEVAQAIVGILIWGVVATLVMTSIMFSSQKLGWSRLNLPLLLGTLFTGDRRAANLLGFGLYFFGGCFFAFFYYLVLAAIGVTNWWIGTLAGLAHAIVLLTVLLPILPYVHPRVASEYDGADIRKRLEPPGFLALHYGYRTPLIALIAHAAYGAILGSGFHGEL